MTKEKTVQGIGPKIADGLQKVLIHFKRGKRERDRASAIPMDSHVGW
jgi:hypothetical protein